MSSRLVLISAGGSDATKKYHKYHQPSTMAKYGDSLCVGVLKKVDTKKGKKNFQKLVSSIFVD